MNAQTKPKSQLDVAREWFGIILLAAAPFTFNPSISLPIEGFVSFRLGLYQALLALFVLIMLPVVWRLRSRLLRSYVVIVPIITLVLLTLVSPLRSVNTSRSLLLSASVLLLLFLLVSGWAYCVMFLSKDTARKLFVAIVSMAALVGVFAVAQLAVNSFADSALGLCAKCGASVFGFPRINGFSAEPQFFASALLAPLLLLFAKLLQPKVSWRIYAAFSFLVFVMVLTLSRGGFVALLVSGLFLIAIQVVRKQLSWSKFLLGALCATVASILGIAALTASATIRYHRANQEISTATFSTIIEQMSGGMINLPYNDAKPVPATSSDQAFQSPGVITASQTDRAGAVSMGLSLWRKDPLTMLAGLGAGNLASYAHQKDSTVPLSFTIYVQYVFILVEFGIVGLSCFVVLTAAAILRAYRRALGSLSIFELALPAVLVAFTVQYLFFGTYINVPYVWLYTGIGLGMTGLKKGTRK